MYFDMIVMGEKYYLSLTNREDVTSLAHTTGLIPVVV